MTDDERKDAALEAADRLYEAADWYHESPTDDNQALLMVRMADYRRIRGDNGKGQG